MDLHPQPPVRRSAGGWDVLAILLAIVAGCVTAVRFLRHSLAVATAAHPCTGACAEGRGMVLVLPTGLVFAGCVAVGIVVSVRCLARIEPSWHWAAALLLPLACGVLGYAVATGLAEAVGRMI
ncbi:hypothetical protein [Microlunatus soli]|nr:hypothetical protein [Microlunatus soli]